MAEYIEREAARKYILDEYPLLQRDRLMRTIDDIPGADVVPIPQGGIGEVSDGYHTFNGLYYQRMVLFAALVKAHKDKAWKSWRHEDGELCFGKENYFIVGIDTPQGSYTYHYHGEHWDLFDCRELPVAKHWDGHTEKDVTRLLSIDVRPVVLCKDCMYAPSGTDDGEDRGFALEWPHDEWPEDNPCPCKCDDGWYSHKPRSNFFCANGKREE